MEILKMDMILKKLRTNPDGRFQHIRNRAKKKGYIK